MRKISSLLLALVAVLAPAQDLHPHHVLIDVSVSGDGSYSEVLNNIANLKKGFAPESVGIEVVCRGAGIDMVIDHNKSLTKRVKDAMHEGVTFAACGFTVAGRKLKKSDLISGVIVVKGGATELVKKQEDGWSYLRGG